MNARILVRDTSKTVPVIEHGAAGNTLVAPIDLFSSVGDMARSTRNHIFVNLGNSNRTAALDPIGAAATFKKFIGVGRRPVHIYRDPEGTRIRVLNDADPATGVDTVTAACNTARAGSVSVIQNHDEGEAMRKETPAKSSKPSASEKGATRRPSLRRPTVPFHSARRTAGLLSHGGRNRTQRRPGN